MRQVRLICRKTNQGDNPIHLQASIHKTPDLPSQFSYYANDYAVHEDASYDTQLELKPFINAPLKNFDQLFDYKASYLSFPLIRSVTSRQKVWRELNKEREKILAMTPAYLAVEPPTQRNLKADIT